MMAFIFMILTQIGFSQNSVVIDREYTVRATVDKKSDIRNQINIELVKAIAKEFGTINTAEFATPSAVEKLSGLVKSSDRWIALSRPGELKVINELAEQKIFVKLRLDQLEKSLSKFGFSSASNLQSSLLVIEGVMPLNLQSQLKESIRIASRDIRALTERRISADSITYEMTMSGTLETIGAKLNGLRVGEYKIRMVKVEGSELKMGVEK